MPPHTHHTEQATHNQDAAEFIITNATYFDWSATMVFYSAVHYVESVLDYLFSNQTELKYFDHKVLIAHSNELVCDEKYKSFNGRPLYSPHKVRKELICSNFPNIKDAYRFINDASHCQRYNNYKQYNQTKCRDLIDKHLLKIKEWHASIVKKSAHSCIK